MCDEPRECPSCGYDYAYEDELYDDEPVVPPSRTERLKRKWHARLVKWGLREDTRTMVNRIMEEAYLPAVREELNRSSMLLSQIEGKPKKKKWWQRSRYDFKLLGYGPMPEKPQPVVFSVHIGRDNGETL